MYDKNDYQLNYEKLTFEDTLREYRMRYIVDYIKTIKSDKILEIGSGCWPLCDYFDDYQKIDIIEPGNHFFKTAKLKVDGNPRVSIYNGFVENVGSNLGNDYDIILIGGFLHEIDNPEEVLAAVREIANPQTIVITFVPNADSFHRLLAFESGLIESKYEFSENDSIFGRRNVFNRASLSSLFVSNGYTVSTIDTYFIKPFSHNQMEQLVSISFFNKALLNGLYNMKNYMIGMGAEIFLAATVIT